MGWRRDKTGRKMEERLERKIGNRNGRIERQMGEKKIV